MKPYAEYVYEIVKKDCEGSVDAIYEDYIIHLVGIKGLYALINAKLVETCGVLHGQQLYTLLELKDRKGD